MIDDFKVGEGRKEGRKDRVVSTTIYQQSIRNEFKNRTIYLCIYQNSSTLLYLFPFILHSFMLLFSPPWFKEGYGFSGLSM